MTNQVELGGGWAGVDDLGMERGTYRLRVGLHGTIIVLTGVGAPALAHLAAELLTVPGVAEYLARAVVVRGTADGWRAPCSTTARRR